MEIILVSFLRQCFRRMHTPQRHHEVLNARNLHQNSQELQQFWQNQSNNH